MLVNAGATKNASATVIVLVLVVRTAPPDDLQLKIQLVAADNPTPLARYLSGKTSEQYTQPVGAQVSP